MHAAHAAGQTDPLWGQGKEARQGMGERSLDLMLPEGRLQGLGRAGPCRVGVQAGCVRRSIWRPSCDLKEGPSLAATGSSDSWPVTADLKPAGSLQKTAVHTPSPHGG